MHFREVQRELNYLWLVNDLYYLKIIPYNILLKYIVEEKLRLKDIKKIYVDDQFLKCELNNGEIHKIIKIKGR